MYWGSGRVAHAFLTSSVDGKEWSATRPGRFYPRKKRAPDTNWTEGWVGLRAGLDAVAKRKIPAPTGNRATVAQPVA
jgi:hypothetical protein